ncbi:PTS glucose transporter subunit IIA, partial [Staphylococcus aureus]|nr:PTS glucose transporter subunit IIA [Staphylococcus aureus]
FKPIACFVGKTLSTRPAIGLKADNGLELLVHIGLDTVQLDGEGFEVLVSSGDEVNVGDPLVRFNLEYINNNAKSVISPIIITNTDQAASINIYDENAVIKGETKVIDVTMN